MSRTNPGAWVILLQRKEEEQGSLAGEVERKGTVWESYRATGRSPESRTSLSEVLTLRRAERFLTLVIKALRLLLMAKQEGWLPHWM